MKFEKLRRAVEACEDVLRKKHDFDARDIEIAKTIERSRFWFLDQSPEAQDAIRKYQTALTDLANAGHDEIERMRKETK